MNRRDERGAISILPLLFIMVISAMGVFTYLQLSFKTIGRIHSKRIAEEIAFNVANRLSSRLSQRLDNSCQFAAEMTAIRNYDNKTPPVVEATYSPVNTIPCFLDDPLEAAVLQSLEITIRPLPSDNDIPSMSRMVRIRVVARNYVDPRKPMEQTHAVADRLVNLRVASLGQHTLVFVGGGAGNKIQVGNGVKLEVIGSTYIASQDPAEAVTLDNFISGGPLPYGNHVTFKNTVFTRSQNVSTSQPRFNQRLIRAVFNGGIETSVHSDIPLPIYTAPPPVWQKNIDYSYMYDKGSGNGESDMAPLPEVGGGKISQISDDYKFNAAAASFTVIPSADVLPVLAETCASSDYDRGDIKPMVVLRANQSFTIDFSRNPMPAVATPNFADMFCGLVRAQTLRIIIKGDTTLYGHFFVNRLEVSGSGTLRLIDPEHSKNAPPTLEPVGGFTNLRRQMKALEVYLGQPFFLPLARTPAAAFANLSEYQPREVSYAFTNGCPTASNVPTAEVPFPPSCACVKPDGSATPDPNILCWPYSISSANRDVSIPATATDPATPLAPAENMFRSGQGGAASGLIFTSEVVL